MIKYFIIHVILPENEAFFNYSVYTPLYLEYIKLKLWLFYLKKKKHKFGSHCGKILYSVLATNQNTVCGTLKAESRIDPFKILNNHENEQGEWSRQEIYMISQKK